MKRLFFISALLLTVAIIGISANKNELPKRNTNANQQKPQKKQVSAVKIGDVYLFADSIAFDKERVANDSIVIFTADEIKMVDTRMNKCRVDISDKACGGTAECINKYDITGQLRAEYKDGHVVIHMGSIAGYGSMTFTGDCNSQYIISLKNAAKCDPCNSITFSNDD